MKKLLLFALVSGILASTLEAAELSPPVITNVTVRGTQKNLRFPLYPSADGYTILSTTNLAQGFTTNGAFVLSPYYVTNTVTLTNGQLSNIVSVSGYEWRTTNTAPNTFYRIGVTPMSNHVALAGHVLNRISYGPTPYDLDQLLATTNGYQTYINQQLQPWNITEDIATQSTNVANLDARFITESTPVNTNANEAPLIADLRAWHTLRAVGARRQLLEILLQFLENHFVTQYSKSFDYLDSPYDDSTIRNRIATQWEYQENRKWRAALLTPGCTFSNLLRISAESPAQIVYLDTVGSRGDRNNVANENYARELLELFTFGVDNGYDQTDVTMMSRFWTGWRTEIVATNDAFNVYAIRSTNAIPPLTWTNGMARSNLLGVWVFNYQTNFHYTNGSTTVFSNKFVPARFGAPYTTQTYGTNVQPGRYELTLPKRLGTNGIQDGYDVIQHLANLPFTQEFISVKLCRIFVHDNFATGYDFTDGVSTPEEDLVRQCMQAWETSNPKGQIWPVVSTILNSELFRSQAAISQKVKTPLEYVVSTVRAFRLSTNNFVAGSFTADSDGYSFAIPLTRMGVMNLFDRVEPDGYPEAAPGWISAGTLAERIRFAQSFCIAAGQSGHSGSQSGTGNDAFTNTFNAYGFITTRLPLVADQKDAAKVADLFLNLLYPGEGAGNLALYRQAAISFLNTDNAGANSPFSALTPSGTATSSYDQRVRGVAGMLLSMQRFQEQ